mgnify:CR=1 FL=1
MPVAMTYDPNACRDRLDAAGGLLRRNPAGGDELDAAAREFAELHEFLVEMDSAWRFETVSGDRRYTKRDHRQLLGLFERWIAAATRLEAAVRAAEASGTRLPHAEAFRRVLEEAREVLAERQIA